MSFSSQCARTVPIRRLFRRLLIGRSDAKRLSQSGVCCRSRFEPQATCDGTGGHEEVRADEPGEESLGAVASHPGTSFAMLDLHGCGYWAIPAFSM